MCRGVDELEDERPAGDNALTTREEVTTYDPTSGNQMSAVRISRPWVVD